MNKVNFRMVWYIILILIGVALAVTPAFGWMDEFWRGMGGGLIGVGVVRLIQIGRYKTNEEYAEKVNVTNHDERNRYLANKARSWAFYYSILLECVGTIVLRVMEYPELSTLLGLVLCAQLLLYWGSWFYLKKRY
ncbi:MAG: hypothetical protein IIY02_01740 [Firmicutes bacterium]|nr:hypothetical protein [Bacillota bacterium]